jgi:hypothetical protein
VGGKIYQTTRRNNAEDSRRHIDFVVKKEVDISKSEIYVSGFLNNRTDTGVTQE